MNTGINLFYSILRKTNLLIFLIMCKAAVVQGISSGKWCLRSWVGSHPVLALYFFHAVYRGKIPEVLKNSRARHVFIPLSYGKYFPVLDRCRLRHHVYVPEFHRPSCDSVGTEVNRSLLAIDFLGQSALHALSVVCIRMFNITYMCIMYTLHNIQHTFRIAFFAKKILQTISERQKGRGLIGKSVLEFFNNLWGPGTKYM
jgi:hypothetical protein